ncbi:hypothetical protein ACN47E_003726 [Coniothyrium glycines]
MRSFAAIAFAATGVSAAAYGYPAESSSVPVYAESSKVPEYAASSAAYVPYSSAVHAAESSKVPEYAASSAAYVPYSSAVPYTTTKVVYGLTTYCPEPTTVTYGSKTYTVSSSTTLVDDDCEYTTTYEVKPTPSAVKTPVHSEYAPPKYSSAAVHYSSAPYPVVSKPAGNTTYPTATGAHPSSTKPATPEFTGAAGKTTAGLLAVAGAAVAFFL